MSMQPTEPRYAELSELDFEELDRLQATEDFDVIEIAGYALADKEELINKPFIITGITFRESDNNNTGWVSVEAITKENQRVVFNDSGTGVFLQLVDLAERRGIFSSGAVNALKNDQSLYGVYFADRETLPERIADKVDVTFSQTGDWNIHWRVGVLKARRGLRKSEYGPREVDGQKLPGGVTYYLA
jgi:hypothetical protein